MHDIRFQYFGYRRECEWIGPLAADVPRPSNDPHVKAPFADLSVG